MNVDPELTTQTTSQDPPADPPQDPPKEDPPAEPPAQSVSYDEHQKLLGRLKKLEDERNTYKDGLKAKELEQMKAQERWKEIAELREKEAEDAKVENESIKKALVRKEKMTAIRTAAMQAGIRKEALDDLDLYDFPEVQIETTSLGNYNIIGVSTAVESLKLKKPYLFGKKSGNLNSTLPEVVDGGRVTIDQIMKAEEKYRKSGSAEDQAAYVKLTREFNKQKRGN